MQIKYEDLTITKNTDEVYTFLILCIIIEPFTVDLFMSGFIAILKEERTHLNHVDVFPLDY